MTFNLFIKSAEELVTTKEQTRTGFITFALEKNRRSTPIIENAKAFKQLALSASDPTELIKIKEIRASLLTASGLSDKSLKHLSEEDKDNAITELVKNFLEPAGENFVDEAVYRYLLIKGDSLGGSMRNLVGAIAQQRFTRTILSNLSVMGVEYFWLENKSKIWKKGTDDNYEIEINLKALSWTINGQSRILAFNLGIPLVRNNIDICLFDGDYTNYNAGSIVKYSEKLLMLGELKGGIDPAGADEHWKTGNSALGRIRKASKENNLNIYTSFLAAAIETKMAHEIWDQLQTGELTCAANMTNEKQLIHFCNWMIGI